MNNIPQIDEKLKTLPQELSKGLRSKINLKTLFLGALNYILSNPGKIILCILLISLVILFIIAIIHPHESVYKVFGVGLLLTILLWSLLTFTNKVKESLSNPCASTLNLGNHLSTAFSFSFVSISCLLYVILNIVLCFCVVYILYILLRSHSFYKYYFQRIPENFKEGADMIFWLPVAIPVFIACIGYIFYALKKESRQKTIDRYIVLYIICTLDG